MRSTGEEIEENCRLVRDVTASQKAKVKQSISLKNCLNSGKEVSQ